MLKLLLKLFSGILLLFVLLVGLGLTGVYFYIWPTFLNDQRLDVSEKTTIDLNKLLEEKKFVAATSELYFGAPNEKVRSAAEHKVNLALKDIIDAVQSDPKKSSVLFIVKNSLFGFDEFDSEEKDRALHYFEKTLEILNIESSNELFNVWRYRFPYGWIF